MSTRLRTAAALIAEEEKYLLYGGREGGRPRGETRRDVPFAVAAVVREGEVEDLHRAPGGVLLLSQAPEHQLEALACAPPIHDVLIVRGSCRYHRHLARNLVDTIRRQLIS